eukprot:scaffold18488_cov59-Cyclotella_meneghiniana.AAC.3
MWCGHGVHLYGEMYPLGLYNFSTLLAEAIIGASAGGWGALLTAPFDVITTRIITQDVVETGMPYFKPYEIFAPETSNSVMSAISFNDLNNPKSVANMRL